MKSVFAITVIALLSTGCVSTSHTKALFTPVGAIGVHSFAPAEQERPSASEADRLAHLMEEHGRDSK